jgi:hypothetical protein
MRKSSTEAEDPNRVAAKVLIALPSRTMLRSDSAEPNWMKSRTARPDPTRAKDRIAIDEPSCTKSKMLIALPKRPNDLKLSALPRFKKSNTLTEDPKRATPQTEMALPT